MLLVDVFNSSWTIHISWTNLTGNALLISTKPSKPPPPHINTRSVHVRVYTDNLIVGDRSTRDHYPNDSICIHRSGEGSDGARVSLAVEIGEDRFDPACDAEFAIDMVEMRLHGIGRDTQLIGDVFIAAS